MPEWTFEDAYQAVYGEEWKETRVDRHIEPLEQPPTLMLRLRCWLHGHVWFQTQEHRSIPMWTAWFTCAKCGHEAIRPENQQSGQPVWLTQEWLRRGLP